MQHSEFTASVFESLSKKSKPWAYLQLLTALRVAIFGNFFTKSLPLSKDNLNSGNLTGQSQMSPRFCCENGTIEIA